MKQVFKLVRTCPVAHEDFTHGRMFLDGVTFCHTVEGNDAQSGGDALDKIAIPRGKYRLVTSMAPRFGRVLPEVLDVPDFSGVRIHGGNTTYDFNGCILVGQYKTATGVAKSAPTVNLIVDTIDDAAELGIETWLEVI